MLLEAVYHRPKQNWAVAYDSRTIQLRIRVKKNDVAEIYAWTGDKYAWEQTSELISMYKFISDEMFDYWECAVQPPFRRLKYGFLLQQGKEKIWMTENGFTATRPKVLEGLFEFPFINPVDVFAPPAWVKNAVFYQIFPERFANGDPSNDPESVLPWGDKPNRYSSFGGDLQGIIDHLDHLTELGINALYLTPVFKATTNHKYDTEDYMQVDPHFGDNETLKKLVKSCHERGIRILLDAVFNHAGRTFAPFVDVLENGEASRFKDWFHVRQFPIVLEGLLPGYDTFAFEPLMPKLNTEHPEVKQYLLEVAEYWIREVGIDGWRLDVANEVDHQFWREFRKVVKTANPDAYILGEIWHESSAWLQGDQFDAVMNYPCTEAVLDFFARGAIDAEQFAHAIGKQLSRYPLQASEVAFNILDSHDTPRFLTQCGGNTRKLMLAALFQFTFMGTPCIYYGDEIGMAGDGDPDSRRCMEWERSRQNRDLFAYYQHLIRIRLEQPALRAGTIRIHEAAPSGTLLAFERRLAEDTIVVLLNNDSTIQSLRVPVGAKDWQDLFTGTLCRAENGVLDVRLPSYGYAILKAVR